MGQTFLSVFLSRRKTREDTNRSFEDSSLSLRHTPTPDPNPGNGWQTSGRPLNERIILMGAAPLRLCAAPASLRGRHSLEPFSRFVQLLEGPAHDAGGSC